MFNSMARTFPKKKKWHAPSPIQEQKPAQPAAAPFSQFLGSEVPELPSLWCFWLR